MQRNAIATILLSLLILFTPKLFSSESSESKSKSPQQILAEAILSCDAKAIHNIMTEAKTGIANATYRIGISTINHVCAEAPPKVVKNLLKLAAKEGKNLDNPSRRKGKIVTRTRPNKFPHLQHWNLIKFRDDCSTIFYDNLTPLELVTKRIEDVSKNPAPGVTIATLFDCIEILEKHTGEKSELTERALLIHQASQTQAQ